MAEPQGGASAVQLSKALFQIIDIALTAGLLPPGKKKLTPAEYGPLIKSVFAALRTNNLTLDDIEPLIDMALPIVLKYVK